MIGDSDTLPDDFEKSDQYISIPHKNELSLDRDLVFDFVSASLPDVFARVPGIFCKKGAYTRDKELLQSKGQLEAWYEFENKATESALGFEEHRRIFVEQIRDLCHFDTSLVICGDVEQA